MPACPHCSAANADSSQFCESCGKALPSPAHTGARIVSQKEFVASEAGRTLQLQQLDKQARSAKNILLIIGILQLAGAALLAVIGFNTTDRDLQGVRVLAVLVGIFGLIYIGLALWARKHPFPASIVGLTIYLTAVAANIISRPISAASSGMIINIIIVAALAKAVAAGAKHRQLKKHLEQAAA